MYCFITCLLLFLLAAVSQVRSETCGKPTDPVCIRSCTQKIAQYWDQGFSTDVKLTFSKTVESFSAELKFSRPLANMETWASKLTTSDNQTYVASNNPFDGHHNANSSENLYYVITYTAVTEPATLVSVKLLGKELCVLP